MRNNNPPNSKRINPLFLAALTIILFAAYAFRLWHLGTQSLWHDEAWSVFQSYTPLHWLDPNYPPAYTLFLGGWIRLAGDEVWTMRYFTLLWSVLTVAAGALLARRWFGAKAGIITAILIAASPTLWVFSQEIRSYVMMPLFTIILLALTDRIVRPQAVIPRRTWIWILLIEILALYTHNLGVPLTAWLNVTVIIAFALQRQWLRILRWIVAQVGLLIVYLPWLITQRPTGTALNTPPKLGLSLFWDIWQSYFTGIKPLLNADSLLTALTAGFALITIIGIIAALVLRSSRRTWLTLSQVILLPIFELTIILAAHIDFHPRYFILGITATLMLTSVGWSALPTLHKNLRNNEHSRVGVYRYIPQLALVILGIAITIRMVSVLYSDPGYQHDDFRAIAQYYAKLDSNSAIIIPYGWEPTLDYYSRKMNFKVPMIGIPLHSSYENAEPILSELLSTDVKHVELFTWYQLPADPRGMFPCWLNVFFDPKGSTTLFGVNTDSYIKGIGESFSSTELMKKPINYVSPSAKVQLQNAQSETRYNRTCLKTTWQLTEPTKETLSLVARVLNPLGEEIGRTESALLNDNQQPTLLWKVGQTQTSFSLIKLPENTVSAAKFPIELTIYSPQQPNGLDVLIDGKIRGKSAQPIVTFNPVNPTIAVQPTDADTKVNDNLYLHAQNIPDLNTPLKPGDDLHITLEWWYTGISADKPLLPQTENVLVKLMSKDGNWSAESTEQLLISPKSMTWHNLHIPAEAKGNAALSVTISDGKSVNLADYTIADIPHVFTQPTVAYSVENADYKFCKLIGVDAPESITYSDQLRVQLVWKASYTISTRVTVFVHLLDANGQVVAQSDQQPTDRPTTGWLPNEYIIDTHLLHWNREYHGTATLEVGMYDPTTGDRDLLTNGSDHVTLPVKIDVK